MSFPQNVTKHLANYDSHVAAERIELSGPNPDVPYSVRRALNGVDVSPENYDSFQDGKLMLYRGDNADIYEELEKDDCLERDFPIFFVDSRARAERFALDKPGSSQRVLMEAEIPVDNLDTFNEMFFDVEHDYSELDFEKEKMYFSEEFNGDLEWVTKNIPTEWIKVQEINKR